MNRKPPIEVTKLDDVTPFGHLAVHTTAMLRTLHSTDAKLALIEDLIGFLERKDSEIRRHARDREV